MGEGTWHRDPQTGCSLWNNMLPVSDSGVKVFSHLAWSAKRSPLPGTQLSSSSFLTFCPLQSRSCYNSRFFSFLSSPGFCSYVLLKPSAPHKNKSPSPKRGWWEQASWHTYLEDMLKATSPALICKEPLEAHSWVCKAPYDWDKREENHHCVDKVLGSPSQDSFPAELLPESSVKHCHGEQYGLLLAETLSFWTLMKQEHAKNTCQCLQQCQAKRAAYGCPRILPAGLELDCSVNIYLHQFLHKVKALTMAIIFPWKILCALYVFN